MASVPPLTAWNAALLSSACSGSASGRFRPADSCGSSASSEQGSRASSGLARSLGVAMHRRMEICRGDATAGQTAALLWNM